uniref:Uncharacterized protein n=1 Tax=Romanomermis culicivorax TaxID=13658 RepID=A0A915HRI8_ROMCU
MSGISKWIKMEGTRERQGVKVTHETLIVRSECFLGPRCTQDIHFPGSDSHI